MSTRQNIDLYSVPITCKPVYWEIVNDALCFWFWFCLALVCLYWSWLNANDELPSCFVILCHANSDYLASDLRLNKRNDSAWSWSASGSLRQTLHSLPSCSGSFPSAPISYGQQEGSGGLKGSSSHPDHICYLTTPQGLLQFCLQFGFNLFSLFCSPSFILEGWENTLADLLHHFSLIPAPQGSNCFSLSPLFSQMVIVADRCSLKA